MRTQDPRVSPPTRPRSLFIGPGHWGRLLLPHVRTHFDVAAIVNTGSPASSGWAADRFPEASQLTSLEEALSLPALDVAVIATPTPTHPTLALQALEAGCHVFVEKPLALRLDEAERVVRAALNADLELFVGYVYLFHPALEIVKALAPPGSIKSLQFDWTRPNLVGGTAREELFCHDLALAIALTDETPDSVAVEQDDGATFRAQVRLPSGLPCSVVLRTSPNEPKRKVVTVECESGAAHVWHDDTVSTTCDGVTSSTRVTPLQAMPRELAAFDAAVHRRGPRMIDDLRFSHGITRLLTAPAAGAGT